MQIENELLRGMSFCTDCNSWYRLPDSLCNCFAPGGKRHVATYLGGALINPGPVPEPPFRVTCYDGGQVSGPTVRMQSSAIEGLRAIGRLDFTDRGRA